jgi:hypothetical protein
MIAGHETRQMGSWVGPLDAVGVGMTEDTGRISALSIMACRARFDISLGELCMQPSTAPNAQRREAGLAVRFRHE